MLQDGKVVLVKAVGVVDASADTAFEVIFNIDRQWRYEYAAHSYHLAHIYVGAKFNNLIYKLCRWDVLTEDLELVDTLDGHYDIVYGTLDAAYQTRQTYLRCLIACTLSFLFS